MIALLSGNKDAFGLYYLVKLAFLWHLTIMYGKVIKRYLHLLVII